MADLEDGKQVREHALRGLDHPEAPVEGGLHVSPRFDGQAVVLHREQGEVALKQLVHRAEHDGIHVHAHHTVVLRQRVCVQPEHLIRAAAATIPHFLAQVLPLDVVHRERQLLVQHPDGSMRSANTPTCAP